MSGGDPDHDVVRAALERVLASTPFRQAERSAALLRYLVSQSLAGNADRLKEYTVGVEALGRGAGFDPRTDPIVRAEASRLRTRLDRYYALEGAEEPIVIALPKGGYAVRVHARAPDAARPDVGPPEVPPTESAGQPTGQPTGQSAGPAPPPVPRAGPSFGTVARWILGAAALTAAFVAGRSGGNGSPSPAPATVLDLLLQSSEQVASEVGTNAVLAPDGQRVVFASVDAQGTMRLRVRRFDGTPAVDLPGTTEGRQPFWSPDGRWIGFWAAGQLRKVAIDGGSPVVLCDAPDFQGASWGSDGTIVAAIGARNQIVRVSANDGEPPRTIVDLSADRLLGSWPQLLPGGEHVLYTAMSAGGVDQARIEVASVADGRRTVLVQGGTFARFVAPGHLIYVNQGTLFAVPVDLARLTTTGDAVPILDDVSYSPVFGHAELSVSTAGDLLYRPNAAGAPTIVARLSRSGAWTALLDAPGRYGWPALSPDGRQLAVSLVESGQAGLALYELDGTARRRWFATDHDAGLWTRDGSALVARRTNHGLSWIPVATGVPRPFHDVPQIVVPWSFAPGDRALGMATMDGATAFDLYTVPVVRSVTPRGDSVHAGAPTALLRTKAMDTYPAISPDGRWLAYATGSSGRAELYVRALADSGDAVLVAPGGRAPRWSPSGSELLFSGPDQRLMAVRWAVRNGRFVAGPPREWTPVRLADTGVLPNFCLAGDADTVIALLPALRVDPNAMRLVQRFSAWLPAGASGGDASARSRGTARIPPLVDPRPAREQAAR